MISTFNRRDSLVHTLESLARQDLPAELAFEVIVVDNNSSDGTQELVEHAAAHPRGRVRYLFEPRQGVSWGRNAGIAAALAPVVAFTDDDNDVSPDWIRTIVDAFATNPEIDAIGGPILPRWPSPPPAWLDRRHWSPLAIVDYGSPAFISSAERPVCLLTANLAVRAHVFDQVGDFSPRFPRGQDHEFLIRFWRAGGRALYLPSLVGFARIPESRLTRTYHRSWHRRHGAVAASMRLQEIIGPAGSLLSAPVEGTRVFGAPGFVYRDLLREFGAWARTIGRRDGSVRFHHANRMRYLTGYVRERGGGTRSESPSWTDSLAHARNLASALMSATGLSATRLAVVAMLMAAMAGGSVFDIVKDREDWPLSSYPMFSTVDTRPILESVRVMGVTEDPVPREIPLLDDDEIAPFDQCRLSTALSGTYSDPSRRALLPTLLRDVLNRYETRRLNGEHHGPPVEAVRAYQMRWTLAPDASNVDAPDSRRLIGEVHQ